MLRTIWLCLAAGLTAAVPLASSPQAPPQPSPARSVIVGQVIDADSGRGVPEAVVQVGPLLRILGPSGTFEESLSAYSAGMRFIVADGQGRFVIRNISAGRIALVFRMNGYMLSSFGQKRPGAPTQEIVVDGVQRFDDVVILAWKNAVITGVVSDEAGAPAVGVSVRALRRTFAGGQSKFALASSGTRTDDRGEYRISGLEPGDYTIAVPSTVVTAPTAIVDSYREAAAAGKSEAIQRLISNSSGLGAPLSSPGIPTTGGSTMLVGTRGRALALPGAASAEAVYQTVFHPGVLNVAQATVISLRSGEERSRVDLQLKVARAFQVSGQVAGGDGFAGSIAVSLVSAGVEQGIDAIGFETATALADANGRFHFLGVPEGDYVIKILRVQRPAPAMSTTSIQVGGQVSTVSEVRPSSGTEGSELPTIWARVAVTVNSDITDFTVPLAHGARINGRLEFEGTTRRPTGRGATITLVGADGRTFGEIPAARSGPDYQFTSSQYPPGRYFVNVTSPGGGWLLKSIAHNGTDLLRNPLTVGAGNLADVVATFTDQSTEVGGTVRDRNAPASDATVALFPAEYQAWIANGMPDRLHRVTTADKTGSFRLTDVIPGEYLVVAFPPNVRRMLQDPQFIAELAPSATRAVLQAGQNAAVSLSMLTIK